MRNAIPRLTTIALLVGAASLFVLGHPAEVRAQAAFCPFGFTLQNGSCIRESDGAFSGAALASQALSELSETTTQETTKNTANAVSTRREQEEQRCAEGFSRVDGVCQPITPPVRVKEAAVVLQPGPPPSPRLKGAKKPKGAAMRREEEQMPAPKIARRERAEARLRPVAVAPPPAMVCKDQPCAPIPAPVPIEPAILFGTWTQVYGDYERRNATGIGTTLLATVPIMNSVVSRSGTVGFLAGADLTSRALFFGNDGLIVGVLAGYLSSDLTLNTSSLSSDITAVANGFGRLTANLSGPTAGLYATYFNGGFSTDFTLRVDALRLNESFNDLLGFNVGGGVTPNPFPSAGGGSVGLLNGTVAGNLNYRFALYPNFWIEPTVGAQYTNSSYGSNAADLGLADGNLVMVQGGARFGTTALINNRVLMTTTLTGLAYDDVLVAGGFIPAAAFNGQNLLVQADQGKVRGRGILALNFDCGQGITSFVQGEVRGGSGLFGAGGKAGVRYQW
jgi:hypothetical protein